MEWIKNLKPRDELLVIETGVNTWNAKVIRFYSSSRVLIEYYPFNETPKRKVFHIQTGRDILSFKNDISLGIICLAPKLTAIN